MLFFWVLKGYIVWGSRRTYQAVKEALSCFLPIGPLPVSPGRPVSLWQQLLAACGGRGWAAQLQTSVGPEPGPPNSLFLFRTHTHTHTLEPTVYPAQRTTFIPLIQSLLVKRSSEAPKLSLFSASSLSPSASPVLPSDIPSLLKVCPSPSLSLYHTECSSIQVHLNNR